MSTLRYVTCFLFLWIMSCSFSLGERMQELEPGDYCVTEQKQNYALLLFRGNSPYGMVWEEIIAPSYALSPLPSSWEEWVAKGAPGHTSWTQYELEPKSYAILEEYSFSQNSWLIQESSELFLSQLLSCKLHHIPPSTRKKMGPPPRQDEADRRPLWNPILILAGNKKKVPCEAWQTRWPADGSLLSSCLLTLYFADKELSLYPLWIEASNGHLSFSIKTIHVGKALTSPRPSSPPRRPPQILSPMTQTTTSLSLQIRTPPYYTKFTLTAFDLLSPNVKIGPIPFLLCPTKEKETFQLKISLQHLERFFAKGHHYKWLLTPEDPLGIPLPLCVESEDFCCPFPEKL